MKLKILIVGLLLVAACLSGCIGGKEEIKVDTYRCMVDEGTLDMWSNGQYELLIAEAYGGGGIYGNYTVRDGTVRLKRTFLGDIVKFVIDGRDLIDKDGDRWVRD